MADYPLLFGIALAINVLLTFRSSSLWTKYCKSRQETAEKDEDDPKDILKHHSLLKRYLLVYLLATLSDWFQGPYVYALYDAYGFSQHDIAILFVAGFGSSMVFGSFIGGMADWGGRRRFVILFAIIYSASCLTKHYNNFSILMLGRLLGGIATSLLFSVFEAWLIRSHADAKLGKNFLSSSFSWAAYGNSIVAIVAGLVANKAASSTPMVSLSTATDATKSMLHVGGYLNPFDLALIALVCCGFAAASLWEENYGHDTPHGTDVETQGSEDDPRNASNQNWYSGLQNAWKATIRSTDILLCGIISSLFEGSMYIFVFMWTPALTSLSTPVEGEDSVKLPFGLIFSTFMVSCMAGSSLFSWMIHTVKGEALGVTVFGISSLSMALIATSSSDTLTFGMMLVFEGMVGMYWPIMGTMKGVIVPEDKRAAIYNLFRIPLNFIVLFSLLTDLTPTQSFALNCGMLAVATALQLVLMKRRLNLSSMSDIKTELTAAPKASSSAPEETTSLTQSGDVSSNAV